MNWQRLSVDHTGPNDLHFVQKQQSVFSGEKSWIYISIGEDVVAVLLDKILDWPSVQQSFRIMMRYHKVKRAALSTSW